MSHSTPNLPLQTMTLEYVDTVAIVTLSRPDAMNSMNDDFFNDFQAIFTELAKNTNTARALLITAEGRGFCAGADLKSQIGPEPVNFKKLLKEQYSPLIVSLKKLHIPTIVAVNGAAAGAGMSLACACDIAIAADDSYFLQAFINIALIPDAGSTYFLPRLVGRARAASLMMLGEKLPAQKALEYGIISEIVASAELRNKGIELAQKMANKPTKSLLIIRQLLDSSESNTLEQQLGIEADAQQAAGSTADFKEGVAAFLTKRPAVFQGK